MTATFISSPSRLYSVCFAPLLLLLYLLLLLCILAFASSIYVPPNDPFQQPTQTIPPQPESEQHLIIQPHLNARTKQPKLLTQHV